TEGVTFGRWMGRWSYAEQMYIRRHIYDTSISREKLMEGLPNRRWKQVSDFLRKYMPDAPMPIPENSPNIMWKARHEALRGRAIGDTDGKRKSDEQGDNEGLLRHLGRQTRRQRQGN